MDSNFPNIIINDLNRLFEYEKLSRDIDSISDTDILRKFAKLYIKLYLKQQEILLEL
jgi:hypothetical protein